MRVFSPRSRPVPVEAFDERYFAGHAKNAYQRVFGVKGFASRRIRRHARPGSTVLDVGCGVGGFLEELGDRVRVHGCDVSPFALDAARAKSPNGSFELIPDDGTLPFAGRQFEVVTLFDVLEHVAEPRRLIAQIFARTQPGGTFFLSTPNPASLGRRWKGADWFGYRDPTHVNLMPVEDVLRTVRDAGFVVEDVRYDGLWDAPYFTRSGTLERIFIQLPMVVTANLFAIRDPRFGENLWLRAHRP